VVAARYSDLKKVKKCSSKGCVVGTSATLFDDFGMLKNNLLQKRLRESSVWSNFRQNRPFDSNFPLFPQ